MEAVIKGVIEAMAIQLKGDEEDHRQQFAGFLKEYARISKHS